MASSAISSGIGVILPLLLVYFGGGIEWSAYFKSAVIICSAGIIMYLICFATVREHVVPDPQQQIDFRLGLKNIYQNKPLLLVQFSNLMVILGKVVRGTFGYYFFSYNIGKLEYMSIYSTISIFAGIAGSALFIFLAKYIGKKNIMFILTIGYVAASAVIYMTGWSNLFIFFACNAVAGVCSSGQSVGVNAMMADTMEYGEWKTGQRNEGVITSTRCFVSKIAAAIGGVLVAAVIGLTGYNGGAEVQSMATLNAFHFMISAGCALVTIVGVVPLVFYDLTEAKHAEIVKELAERKANQDKQ